MRVNVFKIKATPIPKRKGISHLFTSTIQNISPGAAISQRALHPPSINGGATPVLGVSVYAAILAQ